MFDIGWTEMLVIAIVMIVVVGPKDLPRMLRTFGKTTAKIRAMAGDFQRQFNEALKEAELDDVKQSIDQLRGLNPANEIRKQLNPFEKAAADVRAGLDSLKPSKPPAAAVSDAQPAEPLKNGATEMPGVAGPEAMPAAPVMTPLNGSAAAPAGAVASAAPAMPAAATEAVPDPAAPAPAAPAAAAEPVTPAGIAAASSAPKAETTAPAPKKAAKSAGPAAAPKPHAAGTRATNGKAAAGKTASARRAPAKAASKPKATAATTRPSDEPAADAVEPSTDKTGAGAA